MKKWKIADALQFQVPVCQTVACSLQELTKTSKTSPLHYLTETSSKLSWGLEAMAR